MSYLIAFEGGDGVGKNTLARRLVENIKASSKDADAILYSFPRYETDVGGAIRRHLVGETELVDRSNRSIKPVRADGGIEHFFDYPTSLDIDLMFQCLMLADKYDAEPEIEDHLRAGRFVVCDRWKDSSRAYGAANGLPPEWLERIHSRLTSASLTFLVQVPEEVALARRPALRDRYEKDRDKQVAVAARYAELAKNVRWQVIDNSGTVEEASKIIWGHVSRRFGL